MEPTSVLSRACGVIRWGGKGWTVRLGLLWTEVTVPCLRAGRFVCGVIQPHGRDEPSRTRESVCARPLAAGPGRAHSLRALGGDLAGARRWRRAPRWAHSARAGWTWKGPSSSRGQGCPKTTDSLSHNDHQHTLVGMWSHQVPRTVCGGCAQYFWEEEADGRGLQITSLCWRHTFLRDGFSCNGVNQV